MKKLLALFGLGILSLSLVGCGAPTPEEKLAQQAEEAMDLADELYNKMEEVSMKVERGEITEEEAEEMMNEISESHAKKAEELSGETGPTELPSWAKKLGLTEPKGLEIQTHYSNETSVDGIEKFDSVTLTYKGDYDTAAKEAKRIAEGAGIDENKMSKAARELAETMGQEPSKDILYSNNFDKTEDYDYIVSISVDEDGTLEINVVNSTQMSEQMQQYAPDEERLEEVARERAERMN